MTAPAASKYSEVLGPRGTRAAMLQHVGPEFRPEPLRIKQRVSTWRPRPQLPAPLVSRVSPPHIVPRIALFAHPVHRGVLYRYTPSEHLEVDPPHLPLLRKPGSPPSRPSQTRQEEGAPSQEALSGPGHVGTLADGVSVFPIAATSHVHPNGPSYPSVVDAVNALEVLIHSHKSGWTTLPLAHLIFWTEREAAIRAQFTLVTEGLARFCNVRMPSLIRKEDSAVPGEDHIEATVLAVVGHRSSETSLPSVHQHSHPHHGTMSNPGPKPARDESIKSQYFSYSSSRTSSSTSDEPSPFLALVVATDPPSPQSLEQSPDAISYSESSTRSEVSSFRTPDSQSPSDAMPAQTRAPQAGATGVTQTTHTHLSLSISQHGANDPRPLLPLHTKHDTVTGTMRGPGAPRAD